MFPIAAALGAISSVAKLGVGIHQNNLANKIKPLYDDSDQRIKLANAQQMFSGRMAGASNLENNIAATQANFNNTAERNATDGSQVLALAGAAQGQSNSAFNDLQTKESQNKYALLNNLNSAYDSMAYFKMQKFQTDTAQKAALRSAGLGNMFGAAQDVYSMATMGSFDDMFGKGGAKMGPGIDLTAGTVRDPAHNVNLQNQIFKNKILDKQLSYSNILNT